MRNIVLIGMPGCGKSTVGVVLAKALGMEFVDSDLVIQSTMGATLAQLIEQHGDDGFRDIENRVNASIDVQNSIIATGGSVVYGAEAMAHLKSIGTVVQFDGHGTVINLVCDGKGRVIVVSCTNVPHIRRNFELTVHDMLRVRRPRVRDDINNPLIS